MAQWQGLQRHAAQRDLPVVTLSMLGERQRFSKRRLLSLSNGHCPVAAACVVAVASGTEDVEGTVDTLGVLAWPAHVVAGERQLAEPSVVDELC